MGRYDFLEAVRNDTVWKKILGKGKDLGGAMTLELTKELSKQYLREIAGLPAE
jgi:hypothetical protein